MPRNKISKEVKDLYLENHKTLMKKIENGTNRWKAIPCSWVGIIIIVIITVLPKTI